MYVNIMKKCDYHWIDKNSKDLINLLNLITWQNLIRRR
jgi:hypothetical protein